MVTAKLLGMLRARCVRACPIHLRYTSAAFGGAAATGASAKKEGVEFSTPFPLCRPGGIPFAERTVATVRQDENLPHGGDRSKVGLPTLDLPLEVR